MREDVKQLLNLQETDQNIQALEAELLRIPQLQEAAKDRLTNGTSSLADATADFKANEVEIKNVELDIGTRRNSIDRLKTQQFETKNVIQLVKVDQQKRKALKTR